ncbi:MAG: mechanosensitive ion channel domain-containing protein [Isosphaeraceae bacterium]
MRRSWIHARGSLTTVGIRATGRRWRPGAGKCACSFFLVAFVTLSLSAKTWGQRLEPQKPRASGDVGAPAVRTYLSDLSSVDVAASRSELLERVRGLEAPSTHGAPGASGASNAGPPAGSAAGLPRGAGIAQTASATPSSVLEQTTDKPLRELLEIRLRWLEEYERATEALRKATSPDPSPEAQRTQAKAELLRLQEILHEGAATADALLPAVFRNPRPNDVNALATEMRNALDAERNDLKEWKAKIESLRLEIAKAESSRNARQSERDKVFQRVATLEAKSSEFEGPVTTAVTAEARQLAQEKLVNFEWESRVESLRLRLIEAQLALERKMAGVRDLNLQICQAQAQIVGKRRNRMEALYKAVVERQEQELSQAAASEETKARGSLDPLVRFKARRTAEILSLEAQVLRSEQALATTPSPSLHEERDLADRAEADFAQIKQLLDDGDVSRLDAVRLNNDFRRIALERERLVKNEMAAVEAHLQYYEEALTSTEIELLSDSPNGRFDHDLLRERLPQSRWSEGEAILGELERKQRDLLVRRRDVLEKLCDRASQTHQQVVRRLAILDEEYGFIRTHIFWVRDQEPLGLGALSQGGREIQSLIKGCLRLAQESAKPKLWARPSGEFLAISAAVFVLPLGLIRLRRAIRSLLESEPPSSPAHTPSSARNKDSTMQALRSLALELLRAVIWPSYLLLAAYTARVAPWPRSLGTVVSACLSVLAIATLVSELLGWLAQPSGWAEHYLDVPRPVARQVGRASRFLIIAAVSLLFPVFLLTHGLIAPEGRPIAAPALGRILVLAFELVVWATCIRLLRARSPLMAWFAPVDPVEPAAEPLLDSAMSSGLAAENPRGRPTAIGSRLRASLAWLGRHRRIAAWTLLAAFASIILLDVRGYSFTARRLAVGGSQTALVFALAVSVYHLAARAIDQNAGRWARPDRSWARRLTSAVALRAAVRTRMAGFGSDSTLTPNQPSETADDSDLHDDLATGLRRLCAYALTLLASLFAALIWDLDLALVRFLMSQPLWPIDPTTQVTLGDVTQATAVVLLGVLAWRYMKTLFALTIFPRMPDDPGVRFAVLTLCRYAVLAVTTIIALGAIHLDLTKIGVVLAALGVGLGFGLQEIVSNFVCGIILLLERPIRIGDVVTVAGSTGKVDRINIRATTIVNSDNQCMIVPNREFITGNLVNWTHKDKIMRVAIKVGVAYGTDPDRVVTLLLAIAGDDPDVLIDPAPGAALEGFGDSALLFSLSAFVPDPGLVGTVRHRLCAEIQRRFSREQINIPLPTQELLVSRVPEGLTQALVTSRQDPALSHRFDPASPNPPAPHGLIAATRPVVLIRDENA